MPIINSEVFDAIKSWSPAMYVGETVLTKNYKYVEEVLNPELPYVIGFEPGSIAYLAKGSTSPCRFLRNKALTEEYFYIYSKGDSILPLNPRFRGQHQIAEGDILLSKDSNVGQVAVVPRGEWEGTYFSSGIVKLNIDKHKFYVLGFLKSPLFIRQVEAVTPKGATIRHAGTKWLKSKIPFPNQGDSESVIFSVTSLVLQLLDAESELIKRSQEVKSLVDVEIRSNQGGLTDISVGTSFKSVVASGRLDAAFHSKECRKLLHLASNYSHGSFSPEEAGFSIIPGPTLEIKIIKQRIDSNDYVEGYYELFLPKNISEYGSMVRTSYLGTPARLPYLSYGDVLVGEAGFRKGRSYIYSGVDNYATTNAHGLIGRRDNVNLVESAYFRSVIDWYRETGLFDLLAVGGSGGHLSPSYFPLLRLPRFPENIKDRLYHLHFGRSELNKNTRAECPDDYHTWHLTLGIDALAKIISYRKSVLNEVYSDIAASKNVNLVELNEKILGVGSAV